jgi:DNA-binding response OmpR family regulator
MRLLVVEDEPDLAGGLRRDLSRNGYAVDVAPDLTQACDRLACVRAGIPPGSEEVRVLTARGGLDDRGRELDEGADYCVVKPFHMVELLARIVTLTRKEFRVLRYLMTRPGIVVSSEDLLEHEFNDSDIRLQRQVALVTGASAGMGSDGNLVLYYGDVPYWDGIVRIGAFEGGRDVLSQQQDGFEVTLEPAG